MWEKNHRKSGADVPPLLGLAVLWFKPFGDFAIVPDGFSLSLAYVFKQFNDLSIREVFNLFQILNEARKCRVAHEVLLFGDEVRHCKTSFLFSSVFISSIRDARYQDFALLGRDVLLNLYHRCRPSVPLSFPKFLLICRGRSCIYFTTVCRCPRSPDTTRRTDGQEFPEGKDKKVFGKFCYLFI